MRTRSRAPRAGGRVAGLHRFSALLHSPGPIGRFFRGWVFPIALAAGVSFPLRSALADWYQVPSGSMRPTILEGDRILVSNLAFGLRIPFTTVWIARWAAPKPGQIVTLASPADGTRLVKRIIGRPGDHICMVEDRLWINGAPITYQALDGEETQRLSRGEAAVSSHALERLPGCPHVVDLTPSLPALRSFPEFIVPAGCYFVMGDNRDNSFDSRYFGLVREARITGRASYVALSFDPERHYLPRFNRWMKRLI